jgi:hypothetical protein
MANSQIPGAFEEQKLSIAFDETRCFTMVIWLLSKI